MQTYRDRLTCKGLAMTLLEYIKGRAKKVIINMITKMASAAKNLARSFLNLPKLQINA